MRPQQVIITRMRIGHSKLTHQYLLSNLSPPTCEECNEQLTIRHLLVTCKKLSQERRSNAVPADIKKIFSSTLNLRKIINFVNQAKMINVL